MKPLNMKRKCSGQDHPSESSPYSKVNWAKSNYFKYDDGLLDGKGVRRAATIISKEFTHLAYLVKEDF